MFADANSQATEDSSSEHHTFYGWDSEKIWVRLHLIEYKKYQPHDSLGDVPPAMF